MKIIIREGYNITTNDFWHDLTDGGYLEPDDMCEKQEDADKVNNAIRVVIDFYQACEEQIPGFIQ